MMSFPIKVNSHKIELTVQASCYCILDLLCVIFGFRMFGKNSESELGLIVVTTF